MNKDSQIIKAQYFNDYKIQIIFSDGFTNVFDFKNLVTSERKEYQPYLDITKFKKFKIQRRVNCIAWGKENQMQVPGFILYSAKKSSVGWVKDETIEELKKRLPRKFYYEMFFYNNVWSGILIVLDLLDGDKNADLFSKKFNNGTDKNYFLEVFTNDFLLKIELQPFCLIYKLRVKNVGSLSYKVNFENEIIGADLKGKKLENYETLFSKVCRLIKKDRKDLSIKFGVIK